MLLPDVNVWLALTFDAHVHHPVAKTWFDGLPNDAVCYFCRITQLGLLRLATNPSVFGKDALTLPEAWQKYDHFLSDPRFHFSTSPPTSRFPGERIRKAKHFHRRSGTTPIWLHSL